MKTLQGIIIVMLSFGLILVTGCDKIKTPTAPTISQQPLLKSSGEIEDNDEDQEDGEDEENDQDQEDSEDEGKDELDNVVDEENDNIEEDEGEEEVGDQQESQLNIVQEETVVNDEDEDEEEDEHVIKLTGFDGPENDDDESPRIFGEELEDNCLLDIDIFVPAAQDPSIPRVLEILDASQGAWTIRNDDMDATTADILANRVHNRTNLLKVDGKPDLAMAGAVPDEDDLVKIELFNPGKLPSVFLSAYAMANEVRGRKVQTNRGLQLPASADGKIKVWRTASRTGAVSLPYQTAGPSEVLWVEGLKAGRYRLVLFHQPNGTLRTAAKVKAMELGDPHGARVNPDIKLDPDLGCRRNVRLTVAVVNIRQVLAATAKREHVFDILWGGRAVVDADVWPGGGKFLWTTSGGLNGRWETGKVHGIRVKEKDNAPGGPAMIERIHGGFAPDVTGVGARVTGTMEYAERFLLKYLVEGAFLERYEPVTLMVPHSVTITPGGGLTGFGGVIWGRAYDVSWSVTYELFDQIGRHLVGRKSKTQYKRQYGSRLQMYEALGMVTNANEDGRENVTMDYVSPIPSRRLRRFSVPIETKQRRNAIPKTGSLSSARFIDNFYLSLSNHNRGIVQQDIREDNSLAGQNIFQVRQDVIVLLKNGKAEYDIRVAGGQVLEIKGPQAAPSPGAPWGGLGFRLQLGGPGGSTPSTGDPDRVPSGHNP